MVDGVNIANNEFSCEFSTKLRDTDTDVTLSMPTHFYLSRIHLQYDNDNGAPLTLKFNDNLNRSLD